MDHNLYLTILGPAGLRKQMLYPPLAENAIFTIVKIKNLSLVETLLESKKVNQREA
jgi:hypothetical protein